MLAKLALVLALYTTVLMAAPEPSYQTLREETGFSLRQYPAMDVVRIFLASEFGAAGRQGFGPLFDYIRGANLEGQKIAMTAPVLQQPQWSAPAPSDGLAKPPHAVDGYWLSFILPAAPDAGGAWPQPEEERLQLGRVPAGLWAVHAYRGGWSQDRYRHELELFEKALTAAGVAYEGAPLFARYNSPFKLWFLRRNEIWYRVPAASLDGEVDF